MNKKKTEESLAEEKEYPSDFGKGFVYCLGLFLAHADRLPHHIETYAKMAVKSDPKLFTEGRAVEMWFYGAADHLFEFQPECAPTEELKKRAMTLKEKCLGWRLVWMPDSKALTREDAYWAIQEAKDILFETDRAHGVPCEKGKWE